LPITEAQFNAGLSLTGWLRQRYDIASDMCVAHGIASINPKKHLIGHHIDWARGFPFEAFGLPDQYATPSPAVSVFGFGYDEGLTQAMGTPWPGVMAAERELEAAARSEGTSVAEMRERRQKVFDQWLSEQVREQDAARAAAALPRSGTGANTASGG
jgi:hypothetical protein